MIISPLGVRTPAEAPYLGRRQTNALTKRAENERNLYAAFWNNQRRRFCPPAHLLTCSDSLPSVEQHLERCPICAEIASTEVEQPDLRPHIDYTLGGNQNIGRGKICMVVPDKEGTYYQSDAVPGFEKEVTFINPPLVVVLTDPSDGLVKTAQLHHEPELAYSGDLFVPMELDTYSAQPYPQLAFAESWNLKQYPVTWLRDTLVAPIEYGLVADITGTSQNSYQVDPKSYLGRFREQELAVGSFFSVTAIHQWDRRNAA